MATREDDSALAVDVDDEPIPEFDGALHHIVELREDISPFGYVVHRPGVEALFFKTIVNVSAHAKERLSLGLVDVDLLRCLREVLWGDSQQLMHHPLL
jgi:hypothetical protein